MLHKEHGKNTVILVAAERDTGCLPCKWWTPVSHIKATAYDGDIDPAIYVIIRSLLKYLAVLDS